MTNLLKRDSYPEDGILQTVYHLGRVSEFLKTGEFQLSTLRELLGDEELLEEIENEVKNIGSWKTKHFASLFELRLYRILIYSLVRTIKPKLAIETGVLHGLTSAFILRALEKNGSGKLISIDLPSYPDDGPSNKDGYVAVLPQGKQPGWAAPQNRHKNRWSLRLDASTNILPNLGSEVEGLSFFLHDSDHTFDTMWFELNWAWEHLESGGILFCDNIESSIAMQEFSRKVDRNMATFPSPDKFINEQPRFGFIVK